MDPTSSVVPLSRRGFMSLTAGMVGSACLSGVDAASSNEKVTTVLGPIQAEEIGLTLTHEHILVDFIGADRVSPGRYDADEVHDVMLPYLIEAKQRGVKTFIDCTPMFLGRDVTLLRRLSKSSGLSIVTNTGLYKEPFLPKYAFDENAEQLAVRWIREASDGIDGTDIRPGFIKIAVNPGHLVDVQRKIVRAAAIASKKTGLVIASHTGHGEAALESLEIIEKEKLPLSRYIVVHADGIDDPLIHDRIAKMGAWVSFDGVGGRPIKEHVEKILRFLEDGHIDHLLLSHDAGWYNVGEPRGGKQRRFTALTDELLPALRSSGVRNPDLHRITVINPRRAFAVSR